MAYRIRTLKGGSKRNRGIERAEKIIGMIHKVARKHDISTDELVKVIHGICAHEERVFLYENAPGMRAQAQELLQILYVYQGRVDVAVTVKRLLEIRQQFVKQYN
jgi:hypothetical protein